MVDTPRVLNQTEIDSLLDFDTIRPGVKQVSWEYAALHLIAEMSGGPIQLVWDAVATRRLEIQTRVDAGEEIDLLEPFCE